MKHNSHPMTRLIAKVSLRDDPCRPACVVGRHAIGASGPGAIARSLGREFDISVAGLVSLW